jgi:cold shock CspA family protein
MPDEALNKQAFADRRQVSASTISKWIKRGHLSGDALTPDGRINIAEAERQLAARLDFSRSPSARHLSIAPQERAALSTSAPQFVPPATLQVALVSATGELLGLATQWLVEDLAPALGDASIIFREWRQFRRYLDEDIRSQRDDYIAAKNFDLHFGLALDEVLMSLKKFVTEDLVSAIDGDPQVASIALNEWRRFWKLLENRYGPSSEEQPEVTIGRARGTVIGAGLIQPAPLNPIALHAADAPVGLQLEQAVAFDAVRDREGLSRAVGVCVCPDEQNGSLFSGLVIAVPLVDEPGLIQPSPQAPVKFSATGAAASLRRGQQVAFDIERDIAHRRDGQERAVNISIVP